MKALIQYYIILFITFISVFSCTPEKTSKTYAVFSGNILNNATNEIRLENPDTVILARVNELGEFKIKFLLQRESDFNYVGNETARIYISPGDSFSLNVDAKDWRTFDNSLTFSGPGSEKNTYFHHEALLIDELLDSRKNELFKLNESDFIVSLDSAVKILKNNYRVFKRDHHKEQYVLMKLEPENLSYLRNSIIIQYYIFNKIHDAGHKEAHAILSGIAKSLNKSKEAYYRLETYKKLLADYFDYLAFNQGIKDDKEVLLFVLMNIDSSLQNLDLRKSVARIAIESYIMKNDWDEGILKELNNIIGTDSFVIFSGIADKLKPLAEGARAPDFIFYDAEGKKYSLDSFAGKYIYMDVWATYCGPCLKEVPYFEKLKSDFKNKNIVFVSISLDRKEGDWLSAIEKNKMTDYQLRPENDWSSDFVQDYSLNHYGIPYYAIIDPNEFIVKLTGPKPSEAKELLNNLLQ